MQKKKQSHKKHSSLLKSIFKLHRKIVWNIPFKPLETLSRQQQQIMFQNQKRLKIFFLFQNLCSGGPLALRSLVRFENQKENKWIRALQEIYS